MRRRGVAGQGHHYRQLMGHAPFAPGYHPRDRTYHCRPRPESTKIVKMFFFVATLNYLAKVLDQRFKPRDSYQF